MSKEREMSQADYCPCPQWGYALTGRLRIDVNGRAEFPQAGDAYHMVPVRTAVADEDTKFLEIALSDLDWRAIVGQ